MKSRNTQFGGLLCIQRTIGSTEVNCFVGQLENTTARTNGLVVHLDTGFGVVLCKLLGEEGVDECATGAQYGFIILGNCF